MDLSLQMAFLNLHDVFLNASLQRKYINKCPIVTDDPSGFTISDRGRFERAWVTFLYVLVEAYRSSAMSKVRLYMASLTDMTDLNSLIRQAKKDGKLANMAAVRHYMCHRDKREYWDEGRVGVCQLAFHEKLHMEFSRVFLDVFKKQKNKTGS